MSYVDGFVLAVPKDRLEEYKALANKASQIWKDCGATSYVECIADDVPYGELTSFPRAVQAKEDDIVIFAWATYPSREARDAANKKIMADPRMPTDMSAMPFDAKRMIFGGFKPFIEL